MYSKEDGLNIPEVYYGQDIEKVNLDLSNPENWRKARPMGFTSIPEIQNPNWGRNDFLDKEDKFILNAYDRGGYVDLFEEYEQQPDEVRAIYDKYQDKIIDGDFDYSDSAEFLKEMESIGYTFEYGLDNEPYGLRPKGVQLNQLRGYEEFENGGQVKTINDKLVYRGDDNRLTTIGTIRNVKGEKRVYKSPFAKVFIKENTDELVENWAKENGYKVWKEDFGDSYKGGGHIVQDSWKKSGKGNLSIEETKKVAKKYAEALSIFDNKKYTVNKFIEPNSFDLDIDGDEFDGGSYSIYGDGSVVNMAVTPSARYGSVSSSVDEIVAKLSYLQMQFENAEFEDMINFEGRKYGEKLVTEMKYARGGSLYEVNRVGENDMPLSESMMGAKNLTELKKRIKEKYGTTEGFRVRKRSKSGAFHRVNFNKGGSTKPNPTQKIKHKDLMNRTDYYAYVKINDYPYTATVRDLNSFKNHLNRKDETFTPNVFGEITYISDNASDEWVYELNKLIDNKKKEMENKMETVQPMYAGGGEVKDLELQRLKLLNKAFRMMPNSPKQLKVRKEIDEIETKISQLKSGSTYAGGGGVGEQKQMSRTILNDTVHKLIKKNGTDFSKYSQYELSTLDSYVSQRDISDEMAQTIWGLAIQNGFNGYMSKVLVVNSGTGKILNYVGKDFSKVDAVNPSKDENTIATLLNNTEVIDVHSDSLRLLSHYDLGIIINKNNADLSNLKMVCSKLKSNNMLIFVAPTSILYGDNAVKTYINEKFDLIKSFCDESSNSCISVLKKL
jgi:hypothetical protein